jgi:hypothetical protein
MRALLFSLVLTIPFVAQADVYFKPGVMYIQDKTIPGGPGGTTETTVTRTFFNASILFSVSDEWVLGGLYDSESRKTESTNSTSELKRTNMGISGGWVSSKDFGAYVLANYFVSCSMTIDTDSYAGKMCYQIDLGLKASVRSTGFGAQLSYRNFTYDKLNSASLDPAREETGIVPFFTVFLKF